MAPRRGSGPAPFADVRDRAEGWVDRPQPDESWDDPALDAYIVDSLAGHEAFEGLAAFARRISPVIYYRAGRAILLRHGRLRGKVGAFAAWYASLGLAKDRVYRAMRLAEHCPSEEALDGLDTTAALARFGALAAKPSGPDRKRIPAAAPASRPGPAPAPVSHPRPTSADTHGPVDDAPCRAWMACRLIEFPELSLTELQREWGSEISQAAYEAVRGLIPTDLFELRGRPTFLRDDRGLWDYSCKFTKALERREEIESREYEDRKFGEAHPIGSIIAEHVLARIYLECAPNEYAPIVLRSRLVALPPAKRLVHQRYEVIEPLPGLRTYELLKARMFTRTARELLAEAFDQCSDLTDEFRGWYDPRDARWRASDPDGRLAEDLKVLSEIRAPEVPAFAGDARILFLPRLGAVSPMDRLVEAIDKLEAVISHVEERTLPAIETLRSLAPRSSTSAGPARRSGGRSRKRTTSWTISGTSQSPWGTSTSPTCVASVPDSSRPHGPRLDRATGTACVPSCRSAGPRPPGQSLRPPGRASGPPGRVGHRIPRAVAP